MIKAEDNIALKSTKSVNDTATDAKAIADNTNQYFWHTSTGSDTGAHITEKTQEAFLADPANGGGNLLARSNGIAVRDGLEELARFGADGAQMGKDESARLVITSDSLVAYNGDSVPFFYVDYDGGQTTEYTDINKRMALSRMFVKTSSSGPTYVPTETQTIQLSDYIGATATVLPFAQWFRRTGASFSPITTTNCTYESRDLLYIATPTFPEIIVGTSGDASVVSELVVRVTANNETFYLALKIAISYIASSNTIEFVYYIPSDAEDVSSYNAYCNFGVHVTMETSTKAPALTFGTDGGDTDGSWSVRLGRSLIAEDANQTAIGKFNSNDSDNAFEIGNGTSDNARSNALAVTWDGNITMALDNYRVPNDVDMKLYDAIIVLGWDSDVLIISEERMKVDTKKLLAKMLTQISKNKRTI